MIFFKEKLYSNSNKNNIKKKKRNEMKENSNNSLNLHKFIKKTQTKINNSNLILYSNYEFFKEIFSSSSNKKHTKKRNEKQKNHNNLLNLHMLIKKTQTKIDKSNLMNILITDVGLPSGYKRSSTMVQRMTKHSSLSFIF